MSLDPRFQQLLDGIAERGDPPLWTLTPEQARSVFVERVGLASRFAEPADLAAVTDRWIPGPGGVLPVRLYRPHGDPAGTLVYFHGGGHVIGSVATHEPLCARLAERSGCTVASVEYRLAPEHPFPSGVNDAYVALCWAARELGDGKLAVGGDSAGGNYAAVCALRAREEGFPPLRLQLLLYPSIDFRGNYPSRVEFGSGYVLDTKTKQWFLDHYLPDGADVADWRISPICADSHEGLPPALILTAEYDPLRDEGEAYGALLPTATVRRYDGTIHGFAQYLGMVDAADAAVDECAAALAAAFA